MLPSLSSNYVRERESEREPVDLLPLCFFCSFVSRKSKYFPRLEETRLSLFYLSRKLELFMSINRTLTNRGNENEQAMAILRPEIVFFQSTWSDASTRGEKCSWESWRSAFTSAVTTEKGAFLCLSFSLRASSEYCSAAKGETTDSRLHLTPLDSSDSSDFTWLHLTPLDFTWLQWLYLIKWLWSHLTSQIILFRYSSTRDEQKNMLNPLRRMSKPCKKVSSVVVLKDNVPWTFLLWWINMKM